MPLRMGPASSRRATVHRPFSRPRRCRRLRLPGCAARSRSSSHRSPTVSDDGLSSGRGGHREPLLTGVDGEVRGPDEAGQGEADAVGQVDREGRCAPRPPPATGMPAAYAFWVSSKLARLVTTSTCPVSGSRPSRERPADHLVDGVVPPDVLPGDEQLAGGREQPRRVDAAGAVERLLRRHAAVRAGCSRTAGSTSRGPGRPHTGSSSAAASMLAVPQTPQALVVSEGAAALSGNEIPARRVTSTTL